MKFPLNGHIQKQWYLKMNDKDVNSYEASLGYKPSADINKLVRKSMI